VALAVCCLAGGLGARVALSLDGVGAGLGGETAPEVEAGLAVERALFGEGPGGFIVSGTAVGVRALGRRTPVRVIGTVGGQTLSIAVAGRPVECALVELADAHGALGELFA
jgi:hypothetical protein